MKRINKYIAKMIIMILLIQPVIAGTSYIRANQQLIAKVNEDSSVDYYQLDAFNNVRTVFNDSGMKKIQDYLPFGKQLLKSDLGSLRYRSGLLDQMTDLYGSYSLEPGRNIVPSPIISMAETQLLNAYAAYRNNPYRSMVFQIPSPFSTTAFEGTPAGAKSQGSITGASPTRASASPNFFISSTKKSPSELYALAQPIGQLIAAAICDNGRCEFEKEETSSLMEVDTPESPTKENTLVYGGDTTGHGVEAASLKDPDIVRMDGITIAFKDKEGNFVTKTFYSNDGGTSTQWFNKFAEQQGANYQIQVFRNGQETFLDFRSSYKGWPVHEGDIMRTSLGDVTITSRINIDNP